MAIAFQYPAFQTGAFQSASYVQLQPDAYFVVTLQYNNRNYYDDIYSVNAIYPTFPMMLPGEEHVLTFDMSLVCTGGILLAGTPTVSVVCTSGTDSNPTSTFTAAPQIDSTKTMVLVPVQVEIEYAEYIFKALCPTTQTDMILALAGKLPVGFP